ncbi:NADPH-dependent FMN reductase [Microbacterium sp.]|uniref:NADPH-dependent FMN reductase n=1 Tax=Microbacterium sp. TaxID=51671 RepID=UPI0039E711F1
MTTHIGIIIGSTRVGRIGDQVARWVHEVASARTDARFEIVDLADYPLPFLHAPGSEGSAAEIQRWSDKIDTFDGFIFVTAEYNHGLPAALKNALDTLNAPWNDKAAGIVSYGGVGGARAAEHLRLVLGELQVADVRTQVPLALATEFDYSGGAPVFAPGEYNVQALNAQLDQVVAWSRALATVRADRAAAAA